MSNMHIQLTGELQPDWLTRIEDAISEAHLAGWRPKAPIVFEGHPYIWEGEPRMATWTIELDEEGQP